MPWAWAGDGVIGSTPLSLAEPQNCSHNLGPIVKALFPLLTLSLEDNFTSIIDQQSSNGNETMHVRHVRGIINAICIFLQIWCLNRGKRILKIG